MRPSLPFATMWAHIAARVLTNGEPDVVFGVVGTLQQARFSAQMRGIRQHQLDGFD